MRQVAVINPINVAQVETSGEANRPDDPIRGSSLPSGSQTPTHDARRSQSLLWGETNLAFQEPKALATAAVPYFPDPTAELSIAVYASDVII